LLPPKSPLLLIALLALPHNANAQMSCDENTGARTIIGTGIGALLGGVISSGDALATGIGAIAGAAVGLGLSCQEQRDYISHRDHVLERGYREDRWDRNRRYRTRIVRTETYSGYTCHEYVSHVVVHDRGRSREETVRETACRYHEGWRVVSHSRHYDDRRYGRGSRQHRDYYRKSYPNHPYQGQQGGFYFGGSIHAR
jgi:hypothetical protein